MHRNIQTLSNLQSTQKVFKGTEILKVFQECSSWASRNDAVRTFLLTLNRKVFAGKFVNPERLVCVAGAYYFQCQVS